MITFKKEKLKFFNDGFEVGDLDFIGDLSAICRFDSKEELMAFIDGLSELGQASDTTTTSCNCSTLGSIGISDERRAEAVKAIDEQFNYLKEQPITNEGQRDLQCTLRTELTALKTEALLAP